jgi:hypothetical protein
MKNTFKKQRIEIVTTRSEYKIKNKLGTTKDKQDITEKSVKNLAINTNSRKP